MLFSSEPVDLSELVGESARLYDNADGGKVRNIPYYMYYIVYIPRADR